MGSLITGIIMLGDSPEDNPSDFRIATLSDLHINSYYNPYIA